MKKILKTVLVIALFLSLAGCQGESKKEEVQKEEKKNEIIDLSTIPTTGYLRTTYPKVLGEVYKEALNNAKEHIEQLGPEEICVEIATETMDDFDDIECLEVLCSDNHYFLLAYKVDDIYYAVDPFQSLRNEEHGWLSGFKGSIKCSYDIDALASDILKTFTYPGNVESVIHYSFDPEAFVKINVEDKREVSSNPLVGTTRIESGTECYFYEYASIPIGLGMAKLSDEEIDELLASNDYAYVASKIETMADCVNYFIRGDFVFGDGLVYGTSYAIGGPQTMKRRVGQCASMSTCMNYMLWGDYDEVGYIAISGHAMLYIKQDGIYYAVNPVSYARMEDTESQFMHKDYRPCAVASSSDFNDIANSIATESGTKYVATISVNTTFCGPNNNSNYVWWIKNNYNVFGDGLGAAQDVWYDESQITMYTSDYKELGYNSPYYDRTGLAYYRGW